MNHITDKAHTEGSPGPIPTTVSEHLCIDFVNSRFHDHTGSGRVYDRLERPEWRAWFAARCGADPQAPLGSALHRQLVALRALLRRLLETRQPPDAATVAALNQILASVTWWPELARGRRGFELRSARSDQGWRAVVAAVVASYAELLVDGGIKDVRTCANPHCSYMFHDGSRNSSRRWCDATVCGNLVNVRRHRARLNATA
jgi:predicted RNA-binding Zn ribbon-like protein